MPLLADLEVFVHDHRPHGALTADATEPVWNGFYSRWRVRAAWRLGGGSHRKKPMLKCCGSRR